MVFGGGKVCAAIGGVGTRWYSYVRCYSVVRKPLDVLFFGTDEFSARSLNTLQKLSLEQPQLLAKLQLVTRPPKWCGRQHSVLKTPPVIEAYKTGSPLFCDTRQEMLDVLMPWLKGCSANHDKMLVAVSYGKLIPSELISMADYSLNVHPSLLPRYKGSAPIQHALLNGDSMTGVSVQTLHPEKFDRGEVIARTPEISIDTLLENATTHEGTWKSDTLIQELGVVGAALLRDVVVNGSYIPSSDKKVLTTNDHIYKPSWAPTIKTKDKQVLWQTYTAEHISTMIAVIGPVYAFKRIQQGKLRKQKDLFADKRVLFHKIEPVTWPAQLLEPGQFVYDQERKVIRVGCALGTQLEVLSLQFEASPIETSEEFTRKLRKRCGPQAAELTFFA
ncbi:similar to Saccharomyces cerevisiae YBL013W FMT1 Methionyl-tRNA formyltransferase, catalyzes the formylation of initiator Met-tRNA in mitochondria [Maudiozyma barnettii]|uniref:Methionyl-tRNA formyltransferase, mitochondrial n=1 Tax=Maudiozyma barnettii TaxID=61262 RepID=A0A8H2VGK4_9SACH|nr:methionyl-tRNA formyltransferase [Kazachstania barnettii]CAB4255090.1 similar to Saccharomyces cerevisiae YBL013W FMT1 Methionyl-tRNA formyltransferase, catalyzes the formylation of initiator Met-tRNA in mitochondria [Kazachstania barnettii]CAD1783361.1 similar to Saccharomyces cerevisiae YBL013W FMT1 Methionyl-tRNA formyltransferase, catalyzes the formylation of initiator Met-tRNA in mitochondria [Kazachstania barnettii]